MSDLPTILFGVGVGLAAVAMLRALGAVAFRGERTPTAESEAPYGWETERPGAGPGPRRRAVDRPAEIADLVEGPAEELVPTDARPPPPRAPVPEGLMVGPIRVPPIGADSGLPAATLRSARRLLDELRPTSDATGPGSGRPVDELARRLGEPRESVQHLVDCLTAAGVLERGPRPPGGGAASRPYRWTARGRSVWTEIARPFAAAPPAAAPRGPSGAGPAAGGTNRAKPPAQG